MSITITYKEDYNRFKGLLNDEQINQLKSEVDFIKDVIEDGKYHNAEYNVGGYDFHWTYNYEEGFFYIQAVSEIPVELPVPTNNVDGYKVLITQGTADEDGDLYTEYIKGYEKLDWITEEDQMEIFNHIEGFYNNRILFQTIMDGISDEDRYDKCNVYSDGVDEYRYDCNVIPYIEEADEPEDADENTIYMELNWKFEVIDY